MPQNETKRDTRRQRAINALLAGQTITDAATAANISRSTLHRWLKQHPFREELHHHRDTLFTYLEDRLRTLADAAINNVSTTLNAGNVQTSLALLRGIGLMPNQRPAPPTTPAPPANQESWQ